MESLESKLERLSPVQRKEVENFVDFIIFRSGEPAPPRMIQQVPPVLSPVPPVLETVPSSPAPVSSPSRMPDLLLEDSLSGPNPSPAPVQEYRTPGDDGISRDYLDYGQFERSPSPATESVKKVKQKISHREDNGKVHQLLEWID
jgi:hypothetical protein